MIDDQDHPRDDLQLLLDDRVPADRRSALETHLTGCARCRRELDALRRVRSAMREDLPQHAVPADVSARVLAALAAEAAVGAGAGAGRFRLSRRALIAGGVAVAAAAGVVLLLPRRRNRDVVGAVASDFERYHSDGTTLELRTDEPAALERFFATRRLSFPTRVFDFGMMGYQLIGGSVHQVGGRESALFAYRGADGRRLLCQMYPGTITELPPALEERVANQIRFRVYRRGEITLVFWQEGQIVCVLVGEGDPAETIQLALAKAGMA